MDVQQELLRERERLRITLASIGDGVISTDAGGRVVFLNGVAETLTGWTQAEAQGRPLTDVFHIVHERTRQTVDNPALRALREGRVVELANHTMLIAQDGSERPVDDSASPMRDDAGQTIGAVLVFRDVTERKRADTERARLAAIVQTSDDAILSKTLDGTIRSWNAAATALFGYSEQEAIGQHISLIIPEDRLGEEQTIIDQIRSGKRVEHFETVRQAKDGRRLDISLTVSPIKDEEGQVVGASKIAREIGDRRRLDFLVELAAATQPLTDAKLIMARTSRLLAERLDVNRCAYAEIEDEHTFVITGDFCRGVPSIVGRWPIGAFGVACERAMRDNEPFVVHDVATDARIQPEDRAGYAQTNIVSVICVPLHKDGKLVAAMAVHQTSPRRWTESEIALMLTVIGRQWESLERAVAARELATSNDRVSIAVAAARLGDWRWDRRSDRVDLSPRAKEIFGVQDGGVFSRAQLRALLHPEDSELADHALQRALETHTPYDVEYRVMRSDGEVWVSNRGRAVYDALGEAVGMYGVFQDISDKKRADQEKDEFIALLAHELRNPLAPVRTGIQLLRMTGDDPARAEKTLNMMDRQLSHMVRLIDDLLDASRISRNKLTLQKARVTLRDVLTSAIEAASPAITAAGHALEVKLPEDAVHLDADLTRLAQVFGNLLNNAAKYTQRRGNIRISAEVTDGQAIVRVGDDGLGIPGESLTRIFDMFTQLGRGNETAGGGLGIGLALVKGLVERHGGTVTATSEGEGKGSTFTVKLPLAETPSEAGSARDAQKTAAPLKVLVADDNEDAAEMLAELLEAWGNEVRVARDGEQAVRVAETFNPDLILMDVGMPNVDGLEATQRIRAQTWGQRAHIVALTGWGQAADRERTRLAGCNGHLVKPVAIPDLQKLLAELVP